MEEFGPELVTNEVPYSNPVFSSSVVAEGLYPADRAGQPSSSIRHFGAHPSVEKRLLLDLSLLAISGRGMRGFHVDEDPAPAYPTVAVLLKGRKVWFVSRQSQTAVRYLVRRGWTIQELVNHVKVLYSVKKSSLEDRGCGSAWRTISGERRRLPCDRSEQRRHPLSASHARPRSD